VSTAPLSCDEAPAATIDDTFKADPVLYYAARTDYSYLRREYILATRALDKTFEREEDMLHMQKRLSSARAALATTLSILDFARGD
jgi:hypothetical protein